MAAEPKLPTSGSSPLYFWNVKRFRPVMLNRALESPSPTLLSQDVGNAHAHRDLADLEEGSVLDVGTHDAVDLRLAPRVVRVGAGIARRSGRRRTGTGSG